MSRELTDLRGEQAKRSGRAGRAAAPCALCGAPRSARHLQQLAVYKRVSVRGCWRRIDDECTSVRRPQVSVGRTVVNDRGRGVSRRRARASIAHNSRGQKGVMEE
jgi:hypothetical protein